MGQPHYDLAAFARPDDKIVRKQSRLFSAWQQGIADSIIKITELDALQSDTAPLCDRIDVVKRFIFGDRLHREFAGQHLAHQLLAPAVQGESAVDSLINSLKMVDRAFLCYLGLVNLRSDNPVVQFADSTVGLIAYQLAWLGEHDYRADFYFVPRKRISRDYTIALWFGVGDSTHSDRVAGSGYFTVDLYPSEPTSRWAVGRVALVGRLFTFRDPLTDMEVGLYTEQCQLVSWASIAGVTDSVITLPVVPDGNQ